MALIVQKYGGSSLASIDFIKNIAKKIISSYEQGNKLVVIVSAMDDTSDKLSSMVGQISKLTTKDQWAEYDTVISSGEQISSGLLALELLSLGFKSRSYQAWQLPILSDNTHGNAKISHINDKILIDALDRGEIPIISGFQGITEKSRISSLGRGGSDITAVAIAVVLRADRCELYKDVAGVYNIDPKIIENSCKLDHVSYEEMLEISASGAKILHKDAVAIAMKRKLPVHVLSSFIEGSGTKLVSNYSENPKRTITAIVHSYDYNKIRLKEIPLHDKILSSVTKAIDEVSYEMMSQDIKNEKSEVSFIVTKQNTDKAIYHLENFQKSIQYQEIITDEEVVKISIIGQNIGSDSLIAERIFSSLAKNDIEIMLVASLKIKITILIAKEQLFLAIKILHNEFNLNYQEGL